jgi:hypothetical protein
MNVKFEQQRVNHEYDSVVIKLIEIILLRSYKASTTIKQKTFWY